LIISRWPAIHLRTAPVSLFLCAVMFSAWVGGFWSGLLAMTISSVAFDYYFLEPFHSFAVRSDEIPRLFIFVVAALFVGSLSAAQRSAMESLRQARDDLKETVQYLQKMNATLQVESRERRQAEEALGQAKADLARVNRVTTMGELTASLAHEVNQPIAAAITNANTCIRWLAAGPPNVEEARAAALRIMKDGTRAAEIVSRIRSLFKKGSTQREQVDLNEVVREMVVLLQSEAARDSISIRTDLAAGLPLLMADRVQLQQVLLNLMLNSFDAMKDMEGTRELAIKSQRAENDRVLISVSDTGVGLPLQQADQIFEAFFTTKVQGTGMGLSISRSIIESHGGHLWATGNSRRGATFQFTLSTTVAAPEMPTTGDENSLRA
jgi:C4-dicarboxylate-specific signal transduction histidine kinase